jgi:hypothetical protein
MGEECKSEEQSKEIGNHLGGKEENVDIEEGKQEDSIYPINLKDLSHHSNIYNDLIKSNPSDPSIASVALNPLIASKSLNTSKSYTNPSKAEIINPLIQEKSFDENKKLIKKEIIPEILK